MSSPNIHQSFQNHIPESKHNINEDINPTDAYENNDYEEDIADDMCCWDDF